MAKPKQQPGLICKNRQAWRDYEIIETLEAGLALTGTEVKSLRRGDGHLNEAWVKLKNDKASLEGAYIGLYAEGNRENHEPVRSRQLLLHKREIRRWQSQVEKKALTCVALRMYFKGPWVKVEIGLARGKRKYDKRQDLKKKQAQRDMQASFRRR